jgi:sporulation protein YlmC with PRC-barrel domain
MEQAGKSVTQTTSFGDYRAVKGVKVPYNMIQNVGFELILKYLKLKLTKGNGCRF